MLLYILVWIKRELGGVIYVNTISSSHDSPISDQSENFFHKNNVSNWIHACLQPQAVICKRFCIRACVKLRLVRVEWQEFRRKTSVYWSKTWREGHGETFNYPTFAKGPACRCFKTIKKQERERGRAREHSSGGQLPSWKKEQQQKATGEKPEGRGEEFRGRLSQTRPSQFLSIEMFENQKSHWNPSVTLTQLQTNGRKVGQR